MTSLLLVRPASFGFNEETAVSNSFQNKDAHLEDHSVVLNEFDALVHRLKKLDIDVHVFHDNPVPPKPDAIFPNNWISFHPDGSVVLYPMAAANRRLERDPKVFDLLKNHFEISQVRDLSFHEEEGIFLEGTGSIVFDHKNKIAYACSSIRTDAALFTSFCTDLGYEPVLFESHDSQGLPVYHTNVVMCCGEDFSVICLDSIPDRFERSYVRSKLANAGEVIEISMDQMSSFSGNMLQVRNRAGEKLLLMSMTAFRSLNEQQKELLEKHVTLCPFEIPTIERIGGGSVRCMLAEVFLPRNS